jgi:glycosyltransferase involved in cell wall biosynthesis
MNQVGENLELTILMPCLNEAETLGACINKAKQFLREYGVTGEVLVADNGSTDGSREIASRLGARLVAVPERGYGNALLAGISAARGRYVVMGDSDDSYDFSALGPYVEKLGQGYDLVMGNRFLGEIKPGAMPLLHRYLGNPVLSFIGRLLFRSPIGDFHCGLRGFNKRAIESLGLQTRGMEFASEMVVKATLRKLRIAEVPITLSPDGRSRPPHLRSWRDGWRHLRFMLLFSPRWLFLYPGLFLLFTGAVVQAALFRRPIALGTVVLDIHTMLYGAGMSILGLQMIWLALFSKVIGIQKGLLPDDPRIYQFLRTFTVEKGLLAGGALFIIGLAFAIESIGQWSQTGFRDLNPSETMRLVIPALTMIVCGVEIGIASFFLGVLGLPTVRNKSSW